MTVHQIMTPDPVTVSMDETLKTIGEKLRRHGIHHLLVMDGTRLAGILSDRDYLKAVSPYVGTASESDRDNNTLKLKAHQIMSRRVISVEHQTSIENAASLLLEKHITCLPVTDATGAVIGIVSWKDIMGHYLRRTWDKEPLENFD